MKKVQTGPNQIKTGITYNGRTQTAYAWAKELNISIRTVYRRMEKGWTDKEIVEGREGYSVRRLHKVVLEYGGESHTLTEWAKILGVKRATLASRYRRGLSVPDILTGDDGNDFTALKFRGKTQSLKDWSNELGMHYNTLYNRLMAGWTVERAFTVKGRIKPKQQELNL